MSIRIEHDVKGAHRSTFGNYEDIGSLIRAILMDGDVKAIVVSDKDREMRFVPQVTKAQGKRT